MLNHTSRSIIDGNSSSLFDLIMDPEVLFASEDHINNIIKISDNLYTVIFQWKKVLLWKYEVKFRLRKLMNQIIYESTEDSRNYMKFSFSVEGKSEGKSEIILEAHMDSGFMASKLGQGDFQNFVDELLASSISKERIRGDGAKKEEGEKKINTGTAKCPHCAFFEPKRLFCYSEFNEIKNMEEPLCKGEKFKEITQ